MSEGDARAAAAAFRDEFHAIEQAVGRAIVGQHEAVRGVVAGLVAGGHVLLEGAPGVGKTRMVRALAEAVDVTFARIQFTPDLMPADIVGTTVVSTLDSGAKEFTLRKGPIFHNVILADEINRATPKTQSALLEAMQERTVTIGGETHTLPPPFYVLATQNPIEMEGTYPLPEAQLDRFILKVEVPYPVGAELKEILTRADAFIDDPDVKPVAAGGLVIDMIKTVREVPVTDAAADMAVRIVELSHPTSDSCPESVSKFIRYGSSPRGGQAMLLIARIRALLEGRYAAGPEDVAASAVPCLRHRILRNFEGEADDVSVDDVIRDVVGAAGGSERASFAAV